MEFLTELWLPALVSAVFVFVVSSVVHMVLPLHKSDHKQLPGEETVLGTMLEQKVTPGSYMFPYASSMEEFTSQEMIDRLNRGPVGFMTVYENGPMKMGRQLGQWFAFSFVVGLVTAYVASFSIEGDPGFLHVFRVTGTIGFIAYAFGVVPDSIWKGQSWSTTMKFVFDGLLYGLATGAAFGWLWPGA